MSLGGILGKTILKAGKAAIKKKKVNPKPASAGSGGRKLPPKAKPGKTLSKSQRKKYEQELKERDKIVQKEIDKGRRFKQEKGKRTLLEGPHKGKSLHIIKSKKEKENEKRLKENIGWFSDLVNNTSTPVKKKAKGGMVVSGVDFVAEQYD